ncbi:MAG: hypothetical protein RL459_203 [Pseudomonadota bacterium]
MFILTMRERWRRWWQRLMAPILVATLSACSTLPGGHPADPLETVNRGTYAFNDAVDRIVLKPVATAYQEITPRPIRSGVRNFFSNLDDVWSAANNLMQFKGADAGDSLARFGMNTFLGLGGIFDIASDLGIERHPEDFGQTLGHWGVGPGPYVVLPLLGPSTLRDTAALPVEYKFDPLEGLDNTGARTALDVLNLVDLRARLLRAGDLIDGAALDTYSFTRDVYLQRRRSLVYDGNPPEDAPTPVP